MDKHLYLNRAGGADSADLFQREFAGQDHAVVAQGGQFPRTLWRVDAHLGRAMQVQRGGDGLYHLGRSQIIRNDGIGPGFGHGAHGIGQTGQFAVIDQRIQGNVYLYAAGVAETDSLFQLVRGKVARGAAGVESRKAQINSISAAENSGAKHFTVTCRG